MYHWPLTAGILGILGNFAMISLLIIIFRHSLFDAGQQSHILIQVSENNLSNVERMVTDFNRSYLPIFRDAGSEYYGSVGNVIVNASNVGLIPAVRLVSLSTRDIQTVFRTIDQHSSINRNSEENDMESISSTGNIYGNPSISGGDDIENFNGIQSASTVDNDTDQDGNISVERNGDGNGIDREQQISGLYHQIDVPETRVSGSISVDNEEFILRQRRTNESSLSSDSVESTKK